MIFDLIHDLSARLPTILFITTEAVSFFHRSPSKAHQIEMVGKTKRRFTHPT